MSGSTFYESCFRMVIINLTKGFYISTTANPRNYFESVPPKLVNDIMSALLDYQRTNGFNVDDSKPLLTSGQLQELKIYDLNKGYFKKIEIITQILGYLESGCEKLKTLHLQVLYLYETRYIPAIRNSLSVILKKTTHLEDLNCCFNFDLKALINCTNLRKLSLHFEPEKNWYEFLKEKEGCFETHKCLELFNICHRHELREGVRYEDLAVILQYCPNLTSLGCIESSGVLCQLDEKMTSGMKLRHCYWKDTLDNDFHRIGEAVKKYTDIVQLDFYSCRSRSVTCLQNLRNLDYLHIALDASVSSDIFNNALKVIGPNLEHLSLKSASPIDIGLLLQNCLNLKYLKIFQCRFAEFTVLSVSLPNLESLSLNDDKEGKVLSLFSGCNKLTELFIIRANLINYETLSDFFNKNLLLSLKVYRLSPHPDISFRELLLRAPHLEKIFYSFHDESYLRRIMNEMNRRVVLSRDTVFDECGFFYKRRKRYEC